MLGSWGLFLSCFTVQNDPLPHTEPSDSPVSGSLPRGRGVRTSSVACGGLGVAHLRLRCTWKKFQRKQGLSNRKRAARQPGRRPFYPVWPEAAPGAPPHLHLLHPGVHVGSSACGSARTFTQNEPVKQPCWRQTSAGLGNIHRYDTELWPWSFPLRRSDDHRLYYCKYDQKRIF